MRVLQENPLLTAAALVAGAFLLSSFLGERSLRCSLAPSYSRSADATADLAEALLHYATSPVVPQQSRAEIRPSFDVLRHHAPCNFMVFALGRDSQIWAAHNTGGTIVFLEEDSEWYSTVLKEASQLRAQYVKYRTQLSEATSLLRGYKSEAMYRPGRAAGVAGLRGNGGSRLALTGMPGGVYERERDVVVIDAPEGYFPVPGGARADGGDLLGGGDGEGAARSGEDGRVPTPRGSVGGEVVRHGVPVCQVSRGRDGPAMTLHHSAGEHHDRYLLLLISIS